jgi:hypothetical protein
MATADNDGTGMPEQLDDPLGTAVPEHLVEHLDTDKPELLSPASRYEAAIADEPPPDVDLTDHPLAEDPFHDWAVFLSSEAYAAF